MEIKHKYAVEVLLKAAFEHAGEMLVYMALDNFPEDKSQVDKLAQEILLGSLTDKAKEYKMEKLLELLGAIRVLKENT